MPRPTRRPLALLGPTVVVALALLVRRAAGFQPAASLLQHKRGARPVHVTSRRSSAQDSDAGTSSRSVTPTGSTGSTSSSRRDALATLLGQGLAASAAVVAAAAVTASSPGRANAAAAVANAASTKAALAAYPAAVTQKVFLDVRITGFRTGQEKATEQEFKGRMVIGLFGKDAPKCVEEFVKYAAAPYGGEEPSYTFSSFIRCDPGVSVTAGRIKGLKEIELAGTKEFDWFGRVIGARGLDEPRPTLPLDRKGLLIKDGDSDAVDPTFQITLDALPERSGRSTVFGVVLEGLEALDEVGATPVYTMEAAGEQPEQLDSIFVNQKKLFLSVAKTFGDERAVDRQGTFLKRVEIVGSGLL